MSVGLPPAVILCRTQMGENIGTAARAMLNFGLTELRLVKPDFGWPNAKAVVAASGAVMVLNRLELFPDLAAATEGGRALHNAVVLLQGGMVRMVAQKTLLPTYDVFEIAVSDYAHPRPELLRCADEVVEETLYSHLLKSNCPVTGQPDWASVHLRYRGPRIDRIGLLRYLVGFREHAGFHEQCVEQIFLDLLQRCRPAQLSVEARYTRRGGLDINPWRATPGCTAPPALRDLRQ